MCRTRRALPFARRLAVTLALVPVVLPQTAALANDPEGGHDEGSGSFFEIGVSAYAGWRAEARVDPRDDGDGEFGIGVDFSGAWYGKRFFLEAVEGSFDGAHFGYALHAGPLWSLDLLLLSIGGDVFLDHDDDEAPASVSAADRELLDRDTVYVASGARAVGWFGNTTVQTRLAVDLEDGGLLAAARVGRVRQAGNWSLYGFLGLEHGSRALAERWYGIDADEATERLPAYRARAFTALDAELGASYPIARHWVLDTRVRLREYPSAVSDSPLVQGERDLLLAGRVSYVF